MSTKKRKFEKINNDDDDDDDDDDFANGLKKISSEKRESPFVKKAEKHLKVIKLLSLFIVEGEEYNYIPIDLSMGNFYCILTFLSKIFPPIFQHYNGRTNDTEKAFWRSISTFVNETIDNESSGITDKMLKLFESKKLGRNRKFCFERRDISGNGNGKMVYRLSRAQCGIKGFKYINFDELQFSEKAKWMTELNSIIDHQNDLPKDIPSYDIFTNIELPKILDRFQKWSTFYKSVEYSEVKSDHVAYLKLVKQKKQQPRIKNDYSKSNNKNNNNSNNNNTTYTNLDNSDKFKIPLWSDIERTKAEQEYLKSEIPISENDKIENQKREKLTSDLNRFFDRKRRIIKDFEKEIYNTHEELKYFPKEILDYHVNKWEESTKQVMIHMKENHTTTRIDSNGKEVKNMNIANPEISGFGFSMDRNLYNIDFEERFEKFEAIQTALVLLLPQNNYNYNTNNHNNNNEQEEKKTETAATAIEVATEIATATKENDDNDDDNDEMMSLINEETQEEMMDMDNNNNNDEKKEEPILYFKLNK